MRSTARLSVVAGPTSTTPTERRHVLVRSTSGVVTTSSAESRLTESWTSSSWSRSSSQPWGRTKPSANVPSGKGWSSTRPVEVSKVWETGSGDERSASRRPSGEKRPAPSAAREIRSGFLTPLVRNSPEEPWLRTRVPLLLTATSGTFALTGT